MKSILGNGAGAEAATPQQRLRMSLPRQRKFTVELAGWPEQRKFMNLRRAVFGACIALAAGASWVGGRLCGRMAGLWTPVVLLLAVAAVLVGGMGFVRGRNGLYLSGFLFGILLLGMGLGALVGTDSEQLAWMAGMVGLPLAGHVLCGFFWPSSPSPFKQFLAWLPWLAVSVAACWYCGADTVVMLVLGVVSNFLVFMDIFTLDASMRLRTSGEFFLAAGDFLYLPLLGERFADTMARGHESRSRREAQ